MAQTTIDAATTSGKGLPARFAGVIFSPRATYADVAARPRVLGMVSVVPAIVVCAMFAFLSTDVHSGAILVIQVLFSLPLAYARENLSGATNLAVFVPVLDDASFAARTLGAVDLFLVWWLVSLAIGLGVLYRKRTAPIATSLLVIYVAIGLIIAAVKTAFAGV